MSHTELGQERLRGVVSSRDADGSFQVDLTQVDGSGGSYGSRAWHGRDSSAGREPRGGSLKLRLGDSVHTLGASGSMSSEAGPGTGAALRPSQLRGGRTYRASDRGGEQPIIKLRVRLR